VASSWRNKYQPEVVALLRELGNDVYDFKNPVEGNTGFSWREIEPDWQHWTPAQYRHALDHPVAVEGHRYDLDAMTACDTCLLVLPSGRSASYEFGWCVGQGKRGVVFIPEPVEPELMYRGASILVTWDELRSAFVDTQATLR